MIWNAEKRIPRNAYVESDGEKWSAIQRIEIKRCMNELYFEFQARDRVSSE